MTRIAAVLLRAYAGLLRLYPRAFRDRFGAEMKATFRDALVERSSPMAQAVLVIRTALNLVPTVMAERLDEWHARRAAHRRWAAHESPFTQDSSMTSIWQDLRYAFRSFGRNPGFVVAVVVTLALGVGANTAVFSVVDSVLLHPLPVDRPEELVAIYKDVSDVRPRAPVSFPLLQAMQERIPSLSGVAGFTTISVIGKTSGGAEQLVTTAVSGNYFSVLGLRSQAGRFVTPADDDIPGAHPLVVLSDAFWARRFNRNAAAVGSTLDIGGNPFTVIGVAPKGFHGTQLGTDNQLWVPLHMLANLGGRAPFTPTFPLFTSQTLNAFSVIARVRPGVTGALLVTELNTLYKQEELANPSPPLASQGYAGHPVERPMSAVPIVEATTLGDHAGLVRFVTVLFVVVGLTLLTACVNVANLLVVRADERLGELSLRASLGASQARIARQLFVESVLLAVAGAGAGAAVDVGIVRILSAFTLPGNIPLSAVNLSPSPRVLGFTVALAILTSLLFGLLPALRASRPDLTSVLRSHGVAGRRGSRAWLLGLQVAMSLTLLVGAGLFVRSMRAGLATDIGFDPRPLAAVTVEVGLMGYKGADAQAYYAEAVRRAADLPGVTGAALSTHVPLASLGGTLPFVGQQEMSSAVVVVSPSYFDVLRLPVVDGRTFTAADDSKALFAAVILNQSAARQLFPDGRALGSDIVHAGSFNFRVVGVVPDTKYASVRDEHVPVIYMPYAQAGSNWGGRPTIIVRSTNPAAALAGLRRELSALPPNPPLQNARLVADQIDAALMPQRFGATLLGLFSLVALAISAVGIYGVVAHSVNRQRPEIGIRIALGAPSMDVLQAVIARNGVVVVVGIVVGLAGAALGSRALAGFLYGITPLDWAAFASATGVMIVAAVLACIVPARRALNVDPLTALRES